ncbi:hypothetical protein J2Y54_000594 [Sphingomonas sp. BE123]|uniref:hypothetical protein n=1 Tax=Sphingomonas sp. BE123 TaxID=2817842 RepID=UPI00285DDAE3|nr:hypothetical protein [Sphingomonas sp. BE123]MDR6851101.1 hypothetical protein [Sphingomonas sp. BE123]
MRVIIDSVAHEIGTIQANPTIGIVDFSRRTTDNFGVTSVVARSFARRMSVRIAMPTEQVDAVQRLLAGLRASVARWEADERFEWLNFDGFYKDFQIDLAIPPLSYCTLTVEGLAQTELVPDSGEDPAPAGSSSTLKMLDPMVVGDAELISSSLAENDHAEWSSVTAYPQGERVIKAATHRVYESAAANNLGNDPESASGHWFEVGPTNRWAMFDQALGSASAAAGAIEVEVHAISSNAVALLDVVGTSVRVEASGYDTTKAVVDGAVTFLDLPVVTGRVRISLSGTGPVAIGTLLVGSLKALGLTEAAPTAAITDFSRKEVDEFGDPSIVERAWAKRMSARALFRADALDVVANRIAAVRARPVLWIGDEDLETLKIYGFFKDFTIDLGQSVGSLSLSVEGLSTAPPPPPYIPPRYEDGTPIDDLRPEAPGATPGAPDGWIIGGTLDPHTGTVEGGLPAEEVLADAEAVQLGSLVATAQGEIARIRDRELMYGEDGADVRTRFRREASARMALAAIVTIVQARLGNVDASVEQLLEAFTDGDEGYARFLLRAQVDEDGQPTSIVGIEGLAGAGGSILKFVADVIQFIHPVTAVPLIYFDTAEGKMKAEAVEVDTLKVNTAVIPVRSTATATLIGVGSGAAWQTALECSIVMPKPGVIEADFLARQSFSSGDQNWAFELLINGIVVFAVNGGRTQDSIPMAGSATVSAGTHTATARWRAADSVTVTTRQMRLKGYPATE